MSAATSRESLIEFPCAFPIKAMGRAGADFEALVLDILRRHTAPSAALPLRARASSNGRYVALTVTIEARDQTQLDAIYRELSAEPRVLMAL